MLVRKLYPVITGLLLLSAQPVWATDLPALFQAVQGELSGNRARDYVMRIWVHDKWCTLPEWWKAAEETASIMRERAFDEVALDGVPADGRTRFGGWTMPLGWEVKQATLEVVEPAGLPDEFRYLCNWQDNPTSLNVWSAPTPPEGILTELALMEGFDPAELSKLNAKGKIVLTGAYTRGLKRYLDPNGILGFVSDNIEGNNRDFINANQWLNGWTDKPGWWFNDYDSRNNFCFSISQKKANYLRDLLRRGRTVRVRAKIDSRYYSDGKLPILTGLIRGSGSEGEEVLITGHLNEWGANDNASGVSASIEAVGVLNDLIKSGKLPRPRRSIRLLFGAEMYGSIPYVVKNLPKMQGKIITAVCCDTPAADYDAATTMLTICLNPNVCPSYTDAVFPEIARLYYARYAPTRPFRTEPFQMGTDTYFCEPLIGAPTHYIGYDNGGHLHHNSMDTIENVDPRTLRELAFLNAAYLYFMADAGIDDLPWIADLASGRGIGVISDKVAAATARLRDAKDGAAFGRAFAKGSESIEYHTGQQKMALAGIERLVPSGNKAQVRAFLASSLRNLDEYGRMALRQFRDTAAERANAAGMTITPYVRPEASWEKEAASLVPKRSIPGTLFFVEIPQAEWKEVASPPVFWSAGNWAAASYWWVDGKRNLKEIKHLCEIEAGRPMDTFNLVNYYRFLEKYKYVELVGK
ncbi:MAG: M28 family peptidase [Candidatus Latescibacterota bacterium]